MIVVWCSTLHAATRTTVAVDLSSLDIASYQALDGLALEKRIVLRFVQEGFAVVDVHEHPDIVVAVRLASGGIMLEARTAHGTRSREIARRDDSLDELHLEIAQKAAELVRSIPVGVERVAPMIEEPRRLEPSVGLDVLWRGGGADVLPRIGVRYGAALAAVASAAVAVSSGPGISVQEWQPQLGATYRVALGTATAIEAGLLLGVLVEHYSVSDPMAQNSRGTLVDVIGSLPVSVSLAPTARWLFGLRLTPGLASEARRHTFDGATIWERGAFRLETGISAALRW